MPLHDPLKQHKQTQHKAQKGDFSLLQKIVNGGIAGTAGVSIVFPLDLVKTRLQNQLVGPTGEKQYKNMIDCFKKTYVTEGFKGMYSGIGINMLLVSPEKGVKLAANDLFRYHLTLEDGSLSLLRQMVAGALAGAAQATISCPMELLKIQMQDAGRIAAQAKIAHKTIKTMSSYQLTKKLLKERGILGLYNGVGATTIRDVFFNVIYFPLLTTLNEIGAHNPEHHPPAWWCFGSGCLAGSTAALALTPMDVVKTRLQTIEKGGHDKHYTSTVDCITKTWKHEGATAFFKGGACRMIVIAPLYGIVQAVYFYGIAENIFGIQ